MSHNFITVEQDLHEQAHASGSPSEAAESKLRSYYGLDSVAADQWPETMKSSVGRGSPRLIDDPIGLALSGGGIRSATFNLGVLQALHKKKLLQGFDYLSTVSGGGYVGAFWSKWRKIQAEEKSAAPENGVGLEGDEPAGETQDSAETNGVFPEPHDPSIRHLRNFSNFLRPRLNLIGFETGRMFTAFLAGIVPTLLVTLAVMMFSLLVWLSLACLLMETPRIFAALFLAALLGTGFVLFWKVWKNWARGEEENTEGEEALKSSLGAVVVSASFLWYFLWPLVPLPATLRIEPVAIDQVAIDHWIAAILPATTLLLPIFVLILLRALRTRSVRDFETRRLRLTPLESALSWTLFLAGAWVALGTAWVGGQVVAGSGLSGVLGTLSVSGAGSGVFVWGRRFLQARSGRSGSKLPAFVGSSSIQLVAYLTLLALLLLVGSLVSTIYEWAGLWGIAGSAFVSFLLLLLPRRFNPQEVGFHGFYRQRLARAFLGAADQTLDPERPDYFDSATLERSRDEISIAEIPPGRPFHLVCCAANDLAGDPIRTLHRGAESAVLSSLGVQVARTWKAWSSSKPLPESRVGEKNAEVRQDDDEEHSAAGALEQGRIEDDEGEETLSADTDDVAQDAETEENKRDEDDTGIGIEISPPPLGSAITASAAAFNSHMGSLSMKLGQAATFLLTALNLRLGMWIDNPRWAKGSKSLKLPFFYRELFGLSDLRADKMHLSDGAHFENLALYELIRRRCRFLLVCDCGADPDYAFGDVANVVRRVRTDFGVEIDIDTDVLRPGEDGIARQSVVSGTVEYPDGKKAVLVLVKPALTGDEPADVSQYARRNAAFPQETTADQFYDEAQWEAYRRLGEHAILRAVKQIGDDLSPPRVASQTPTVEVRKQAARLRWAMAQGSYQWFASPERDPAALKAIETRWADLEEDLAKDNSTVALARQVLLPVGKWSGKARDLDDSAIWIAPLAYLRRALLLMEDVLRVQNLDGARSNPQSFGWMNRIGTWATSDALVAWWPWLASSTSRRLRNYLQMEFGLPSSRSAHVEIRKVKDKSTGYALAEWHARVARAKYVQAVPEPESESQMEPEWEEQISDFECKTRGLRPVRYGLFLPMVTKSPEQNPECVYDLMVATARVFSRKGDQTASWHQSDFFIPPGLWSSGFAERFLVRLCEELSKSAPKNSPISLDVCFGKPPGAVAVALYAGAGFNIRGVIATRTLHNPAGGKEKNGSGSANRDVREVKLLAEAPDEIDP